MKNVKEEDKNRMRRRWGKINIVKREKYLGGKLWRGRKIKKK